MNGKRACVLLVADRNTAATFKGFFSRDGWHLSLGCARFDIRAQTGGDLIVGEGGNDPGVYTMGHELLRPFQRTHQRALVVLDCEWDGSLGKATIEQDITTNLVRTGWPAEAVRVIAIDPELENWIWQENHHVAQAFRYRGQTPLRQWLAESGWWPENALKPLRPKEAVEWVLQKTRQPRSSAIYQQLATRMSVNGCTDAAFLALRTQLRHWFPPGVSA